MKRNYRPNNFLAELPQYSAAHQLQTLAFSAVPVVPDEEEQLEIELTGKRLLVMIN
jgi:hypothetical protein